MNFTDPSGAYGTNCLDGNGFVIDPSGMKVEQFFDFETGCTTETFPDGFSEIYCPNEEQPLTN